MKMIKVACFRKYTMIGEAIRWWTNGVYDHAGILLSDDKTLLETNGKIVHETNLFKEHQPGTLVDLFYIPAMTSIEEEKILTFAYKQIGKGYDWMSIFNFVVKFEDPAVVQEKRKAKAKWQCSEYVFASVGRAFPLLSRIQPYQIHPNLLPVSPILKYHSRIIV